MSIPEDFIGAEIDRLKETIRAFGRGDIVPITDKDAEIERLTAALKDLFLLACISQDILADAPQMKAAGKLLAVVEQKETPKP